MTTIHYAAKFKGRTEAQTVPLCTQWALRQKFGQTTDDKSKVTCSRCAKKLDVTPAAKQLPKNLGTCPCCFRNQKTLSGARMVHHGYQRPGWGEIVGDCFGVKYPRFEDSCEGTIAYRTVVTALLANRQEQLAKHVAGVPSYRFSYELYERDAEGKIVYRPGKWGMREAARSTKSVEVFAGSQGESLQTTDGRIYVPSFNTLRANCISELTYNIKALTNTVAQLTEKIDNWKPAAV